MITTTQIRIAFNNNEDSIAREKVKQHPIAII